MKEEFKVGDLVTWNRKVFLSNRVYLIIKINKEAGFGGELTLTCQSDGSTIWSFAELFRKLNK